MTTQQLKDKIFEIEDSYINNGFLNVPISKIEEITGLNKMNICKMINNSQETKYDYYVTGNNIGAKRDYVK